MSEKKWTPGPWCLGVRNGQEIDINAPVEPRMHYASWAGLATVYGADGQPKIGGEIMIANAHLIAAAPELYEALEECVKQIRGIASEMDVPESAIAALKKARGES